jgi:hypothetical protein
MVVMTPRRLALMDFAEGVAYTPVVLLIPMPESTNQAIAVVFKPFQATVKYAIYFCNELKLIETY